MMPRHRLLLAAIALAAGCRAGPDRRQNTLAAEGRDDRGVASGPVVRDLRSPPDSTRIIYTAPTPLALRSATSAGAATTGAPFGISSPDSARRAGTGGARSAGPGAADSAGGAKPRAGPPRTGAATREHP